MDGDVRLSFGVKTQHGLSPRRKSGMLSPSRTGGERILHRLCGGSNCHPSSKINSACSGANPSFACAETSDKSDTVHSSARSRPEPAPPFAMPTCP